MGFLDKMKSSVSGVSAQQRYASNIRKINAQIQSNEKEIERLTMQVGIQCVNLHLEEPGTEYENLFAVIRQYQSENRAAEEKIQHLREQQEEEEFARQQELKRQQEMQVQADAESKVCPGCGGRNDLDSMFCVHCGNPLSKEPEMAQPDQKQDD